MKIAIIGTKLIGGTLGKAWHRAGHDITFGVRDLSRSYDLPGSIATIDEAIEKNDIVVFAIPGRAMQEMIADYTIEDKIIIDATNGGDTTDKTMAQIVADQFPRAQVYKAFNSLGYENFENPMFGEDNADLLFIGAEEKQEIVAQVIQDIGLNPIYVGELDQQGILDAGMRFWFALTRKYGRHVAFKILHDK